MIMDKRGTVFGREVAYLLVGAAAKAAIQQGKERSETGRLL